MALSGTRTEVGRRFRMRERLVAVGDDYWIEDARGRRAYRVSGRPALLRDTWILEDPRGARLATIRERRLAVRPAVTVEVGAQTATVRKAVIGVRARFHVDLARARDLTVQGDVLDHEYVIVQDGTRLGRVSKRWFRLRDTYGVEVYGATDPILVLSVTVAVVALAHD